MFASLVFFFKPDLSVSYLVFNTNPLVSILFTFAANLSYTVFLTTPLFTTLLSLLKSIGTAFNLPTARGDSIIPSRPGSRWVYIFFVMLRDDKLRGGEVVLD